MELRGNTKLALTSLPLKCVTNDDINIQKKMKNRIFFAIFYTLEHHQDAYSVCSAESVDLFPCDPLCVVTVKFLTFSTYECAYFWISFT